MPQGTLTERDIEVIRAIVAEHHKCESFTDEERQVLRDMASGGKLVKRAMIYIFAGLALLSVLSDTALRKVAQVLGVLK